VPVESRVDEPDHRVPGGDTMSVLRRVAGSYPSFLFHMSADRVPAFGLLLVR